ncbi:hypothetical protein OG539_41090 [Actinacidiphila glaucinigra]|nr:hypothetical protein [Actinacidiphila glaucinigra]WSD57847.1 hypothetical protein OIE69_02400 [Actinacidiphila glaucinigra]
MTQAAGRTNFYKIEAVFVGYDMVYQVQAVVTVSRTAVTDLGAGGPR